VNEVFSFYKAVDPLKGSWDGYGHFPIGDGDFLAFVADAPSGASIHTPEVMKQFWQEYAVRARKSELPVIELVDALNRLQSRLQQRARSENVLYQATIVLVSKAGSKLLYCCIGDSTLQLYRDGKLFRLSEAEIWDGALIVQADEKTHERQKTSDLRFIGSSGSFVQTSEIKMLELKDRDTILLSSDGVEDLLSPDQLLTLLRSTPDRLREQLEGIFQPGRIKDDATMLAVPVKVLPEFQTEKEFLQLRHQLDQIQRDQNELRKQFMEFTPSVARLNKLETSFRNLSDELQKSTNRTQNNVSHSVGGRRMSFPWMIAILCLLIGTAAGAFFMRNNRSSVANVQSPAPKETPQPGPKRIPIVPPEIPPEETCTYVVQKGDSLDKIASGRGLAVSELLKLNPKIKREIPLKIGENITVCKEDNP
jgi:serine/threonine protein phosphatase PrpC